ncbi:PorV/PorQ family protein [candidate division KSB1 bacterium]|nr:PorV/PorQ family protein [candidate division KSB1 bacterium]
MTKIKFFIFILLSFYVVASSSAEVNSGNTGLAFLKIGAGSRAIGMGEAFTALSDDASATYWNPAGLASLQKAQFMFTHNTWFQDITHSCMAYTFGVKSHHIGLSFVSTHVDGIERRVNPTTDPLYTIDAHDIMVGISYSRKFRDDVHWGLTLKYLYEKIYLESSYGVAADIGILYHTPIQGLHLGAVIQNIGKMSEFKEESTTLPTWAKAGVGYSLPLNAYGRFTVVADFIQVFDAAFHAHFGLEYEIRRLFAFRIGYLTGYEERSLQGGFGMKLKRYLIDYAYVPFTSDLGNSHRISFGINF